MRVFIPILAALVAACRLAHAAETLSGPYPAEILRVIDGDTVEARVHVWLGLDVTTRVHLRNMDSPELHGPCPDAGQAARDALIGLLGDNPVILSRIANDKYGGRVDAVMTLPTGVDVSTAMLAAGHARKIKGDFNCPSTAPRAKGRFIAEFREGNPASVISNEAKLRRNLVSAEKPSPRKRDFSSPAARSK